MLFSLVLLGQGLYAQCTASFMYIQSGDTIVFVDSSMSQNGHTTTWIFGDGSTGTGSTVTHVYSTTTTNYFTACVVIYDSAASCMDSICQQIVIPNTRSTCVANFTTSVNGDTVQFTNTSTGGASYSWSFGNGATSTATNPTYAYGTPTGGTMSYGVCLRVLDSSGNVCDSICKYVTISGSSSCSPSFQFAQDSGNSYKYYFYGSTPPAGGSAQWIINDGSYHYYNGQNATHTFNTTASSAWVAYYLYDSSRAFCDSTSMFISLVNTPNCSAYWTYRNIGGDSIISTTNGSSLPSGGSYLWDFGDGNTSTATSPTHSYVYSANTVTYVACLKVLDSSGAVCDSFCRYITVRGFNSTSCTASLDYTISGDTIVFTDSSASVNGHTAYWYINGASYTGSTVTYVYNSTGAGYVSACLVINDSVANCWDSTCINIFMQSPRNCQASFYVGLDTTNTYTIYIINNSTGTTAYTSYLWTFGDGDSSTLQNPTHDYDSFGLFNLCLTISDSNCTSTYCDSIGLDSNGNLLKLDGFKIIVVNEDDLTSVNDPEKVSKLNVYPNPSSGVVNLEFEATSSENARIQVIDAMGREVISQEKFVTGGNNEIELNLNEVSEGLYFIKINVGNYNACKRVLLSR